MEIEENNLYITDLGSRNGVYFNGIRIPSKERKLIGPDSEIRITDAYVFNFELATKEKIKEISYNKSAPILLLETLPIQMETEDLTTRKLPQKNRPVKTKPKPKKNTKKDLDWLKMLIGFIAILAIFFILN